MGEGFLDRAYRFGGVAVVPASRVMGWVEIHVIDGALDMVAESRLRGRAARLAGAGEGPAAAGRPLCRVVALGAVGIVLAAGGPDDAPPAIRRRPPRPPRSPPCSSAPSSGPGGRRARSALFPSAPSCTAADPIRLPSAPRARTRLRRLHWYGFRDQSGTYAYEETRSWLTAVGSTTSASTAVGMPLVL